MNHIEELKQLSPKTLKTLISNVACMVKSTSRFSGLPLWSIVGHVCSVGSTSSHELCMKANLNPHQTITRSMSGHSLEQAPIRPNPASNAANTKHPGDARG